MGIIFNSAQEFQKQLEDLRTAYEPLVVECEKIEAALDVCKSEGYERFCNEVLQRELNAIAHERAKADPADENLNRELRARYEQVESLKQRRGELEEKYRVLTLERSSLMTRIVKAQDDLNKKLKAEERKAATHA